MRILNLTFLTFILSVFFPEPTPEAPTAVAFPLPIVNSPGAANLIYQSRDGGQSWQDISETLPVNKAPDDFFAGASEVYLRVNDDVYRSKSNLKTPVWEKENGLDTRNASIAFNHSGIMAYNYDGLLHKKESAKGTWLPMYTNIQKSLMRGVFETSNGTVLLGSDRGLFKSNDLGKTWTQVHHEGWVIDIIESEGVLLATGQNGILRSTDNGDTWEWVISDGGAGIAVEVINGGFAAISASSKTISRRVHISLDKGKTWQAIDEGLRPSLSISSIKQVGNYLFCGHPDGVFRSADLGNTWHLVHSAMEKKAVRYGQSWTIVESSAPNKVLTLYTSGNVLYAVIKDMGC